MPDFSEKHTNWYVGGLLVMVASLPLSRAGLSLSLGFLLLLHGWHFRRWQANAFPPGWWRWGLAMVVAYGLGLLSSENREAGLNLLQILAPLAILPWLLATGPRLSSRQFRLIALVYLLACVLICVLALGLAAGDAWQQGEWSYRTFSYERLTGRIFLHPTFLALMLNIAALLGAWLWKEQASRSRGAWLLLIAGGLLALGLQLLLAARMQQLLFLLLVLGIMGWLGWKQDRWKRSLGIGLLLLGIGGLVFLGSPANRSRFALLLPNPEAATAIEELPYDGVAVRKYLWSRSWALILEEPLGYGTGAAQTALRGVFATEGFPRPDMNAHQQWLETGLALGFPGMILLTFGWLWACWHCYRRRNWLGFGFFVLLALSGLTEVILSRQWGVFLLAFWGGILATRGQETGAMAGKSSSWQS
jgi:hypothetical protein